MTQAVEQAWLNIAEAATYTNSGESTIRYAAQAGELRGGQRVRRGHWRFHRDDLDRWMAGLPPREDGAK